MTDPARLHELLEKATPGPWLAEGKYVMFTYTDEGDRFRTLLMTYENAELVAAAVNALPGLLEQHKQMREALARAAHISEHLFQMIDPQTWRDSGGDDGQGHYEGDYRAEQTREEIARWAALVVRPDQKGTVE